LSKEDRQRIQELSLEADELRRTLDSCFGNKKKEEEEELEGGQEEEEEEEEWEETASELEMAPLQPKRKVGG
jgi:hypothetical protein